MRQIILFILLLLSFEISAQGWRSHDNKDLPMQIRLMSRDYSVRIKPQGKPWQEVKVYGALVSNYDRHSANHQDFVGVERTAMSFASFCDDFQGAVKVRITRHGEAFERVEVRPSKYAIEPKRVGRNTIEFEIHDPQEKISVEFDSDRDHNLFIFPDRHDQYKPNPFQEGVIYYGAGLHYAGIINLKSNQTLYLDQGAVVYGQVRAVDAEHVKIAGRGILCGSMADHAEFRRGRLVDFLRCRDVTMSGITLRDSPAWSLCMTDCQMVHINNVKEICWMINSDGVDVCNSREVVIENCFMRNYDDNVSIKAVPWGKDDTANVTVQGCTMWADCAHNFLVGPEAPEHTISRTRFLGSVILESREKADPWRGAMAVMISDEGYYEDVLIDGVEVEGIRGGMIMSFDFAKYTSRGRSAKDIVVRNVTYKGAEPPRSVIRGLDQNRQVENVTLSNLIFNGEKICEENLSRHFEVKFVKALKIDN